MAQHLDDLRRVIDGQCGLGDEGEHGGVGGLDGLRVGDALHQRHAAGRELAHGADDFRVAGVADHQDVALLGAAAGEVPLGLAVHLADQGAGRVEIHEVAAFSLGRDGFRDAMGGKHDGGVGGNFIQLFDEHGALGFQAFDDGTVVDDFMTYVDGLAVAAKGFLHNADGAVDPGAEAAGAGEHDAEFRPPLEGGLVHGQQRARVRDVLHVVRPVRGAHNAPYLLSARHKPTMAPAPPRPARRPP